MCFYTVTKLKLKTLTVAKLSGQRWVWQRRCFGLEIIIHHCRMSCCSQKHQHRHCRQKRCKRKKENNVENILNIKYIDDLFLLYAFFSFPNKFLPLLLSFIHKKKKYLGQALWKFYFKRFFFFFLLHGSITEQTGNLRFSRYVCLCVTMLSFGDVMCSAPSACTGVTNRSALSLFIQICTANQNTEGFFSFEKWKVFPFDTRLESSHLLHRHAETKPMGEARDPQRQVLLKNTGWVTFNQFHSPVKLLHWQRMLGNPLFFHRRDHNGSFIFLWPLNTWREN